MHRPSRRSFSLSLVAIIVAACASQAPATLNSTEHPPARYLFTWLGDEDRADSDFLAVIDLAREGDRYGTIVATMPVGEKALWPHHTEHELGASKIASVRRVGERCTTFDEVSPSVSPTDRAVCQFPAAEPLEQTGVMSVSALP